MEAHCSNAKTGGLAQALTPSLEPTSDSVSESNDSNPTFTAQAENETTNSSIKLNVHPKIVSPWDGEKLQLTTHISPSEFPSESSSNCQQNVPCIVDGAVKTVQKRVQGLSHSVSADQPQADGDSCYSSHEDTITANDNTLCPPGKTEDFGICMQIQPNCKPFSDQEEAPPSYLEIKSEEKDAWFYKSLSLNLGMIYTMFLVTIGIIIYIWDVLGSNEIPVAEGFNIYLIVIQLLFLMYIHFDCRRYISTIAKKLEESERQSNEAVYNGSGNTVAEFSCGSSNNGCSDDVPQDYGFTSGRHSGSLYVKIGATGNPVCLSYGSNP